MPTCSFRSALPRYGPRSRATPSGPRPHGWHARGMTISAEPPSQGSGSRNPERSQNPASPPSHPSGSMCSARARNQLMAKARNFSSVPAETHEVGVFCARNCSRCMSTSVRDYRASMNPPKTEFPMRAGLAKSEPARVAWWKENGTCERRLAKNKSTSRGF